MIYIYSSLSNDFVSLPTSYLMPFALNAHEVAAKDSAALRPSELALPQCHVAGACKTPCKPLVHAQVQDSAADPSSSTKPASQSAGKQAAGETTGAGQQGGSEEGGPPKPATGQGDEHGPEATGEHCRPACTSHDAAQCGVPIAAASA